MPRLLSILTLSFVCCLTKLTAIGFADSSSEPLFGTAKSYQHVLVEKVLSSDTFVLQGGEKIKLIGLVSPEPPKRKKVERDKYGFIIAETDPTISFEQQALDFTKSLLEGKFIRLEFDAELKSEDFKTFAYAFLDDQTFVNAEIIRQGFADLKIVSPNTKYAQSLREAYQEARKEKRGLQGE